MAASQHPAGVFGTDTTVEMGDFVLFDLAGVALTLYPRDLLAEDAGVTPSRGGFGGATLAQNVASHEEVDQIIADACAAGATSAALTVIPRSRAERLRAASCGESRH